MVYYEHFNTQKKNRKLYHVGDNYLVYKYRKDIINRKLLHLQNMTSYSSKAQRVHVTSSARQDVKRPMPVGDSAAAIFRNV